MKVETPIDVTAIALALEDKKAEDVEIINVSQKMPLADFYIIATASNPRQLNALVDVAVEAVVKHGGKINHIEGKNKSEDWILIDANHLIIHLFTPLARSQFKLSELYK